MDDRSKTKDQLIQELSKLRARLKDASENQIYTAAREAEEALKISEEKYRSIFENATEGIFQSTPEGRFMNVNPAFAKMCGFTSPGEMLATIEDIPNQHYANPDERKTFVDLIRKNGRIENFVHQVFRKDGEKIWVSTNARAVKDENGRIIYYEGTHENVTKRKQAEEELRKNEEMLKSVFRAAPIGIGIVHDRILGWTNEYLSSITGYSQKELFGKSARILYPNDIEFSLVGDVKYRQIKKQGIGSVETHWQKKNGPIIDIYLSSSYVNPSDPSAGLVFTALDITERKLFEERLIESEERYRTSIENSNDGVAIVKGDTHLYVNRKFVEIFGYDSTDEIIGQPVTITVHPDDRKKVVEINRKRQQNGGAPSRYEFKGLKKNGEVVTVEVSATKTTYSGESMSLVYLRDVTERRSLEAQLLHAQKMEAVGQLAGGVAHDFNNILTAIIGYGSLLHMKMLEDEPLRVYAEHILASAQKATHLTQSLLAFSRKQILNPEPANVNEILLTVRRLLSRTIGEDIELITSVGEGELTIVADVVQIEQVLMNLAINARDAMPDGGTLTIGIDPVYMDPAYVRRSSFGRHGHFVRISVIDTGIGMDETTKERIFEPFFTTKEVGKGTGLGLSMVYGIVNQHNGFLRVLSELHKGTTFEIFLPLIRAQATREKKKEEIPFLTGSGVILMAEDDTTVRRLTKQLLEDAGYTVIEAFDGEDVIAKFNDNRGKIDLLLLDAVMPKKNGKEAYEMISRIRPGIKTLFMSGYSEDIIHKRGILQNGLNFITKPVAPNALLKKLKEVLEQAPDESDLSLDL